jgi:hypothetical protein
MRHAELQWLEPRPTTEPEPESEPEPEPEPELELELELELEHEHGDSCTGLLLRTTRALHFDAWILCLHSEAQRAAFGLRRQTDERMIHSPRIGSGEDGEDQMCAEWAE